MASNNSRNYKNLEVKKKPNFSPFSEKYVGSRVCCAKTQLARKKDLLTCRHASTTSLAIGVHREPLFGQPCMGDPTHLVQAVTNRYHVTITASILCLIVIKSCVYQVLGWCLSCVELCAIFVLIEIVFCTKTHDFQNISGNNEIRKKKQLHSSL